MTPFLQAISNIDIENSQDPNTEIFHGQSFPKELLYSHRMYNKLLEFCPTASDELKIATKAQHICRWKSARESYQMDRVGYLKWRTDLKKFHAETTSKILLEVGYDQNFADRVSFLIEKKSLKKDAETQTLEDIICLVFMEFYFDDFVVKHSKEKILDIIAKTWSKMSSKGQEAALNISFSEVGLPLIKEALSL